MQEEIEKSWVPFPRKILSDYHNGIINKNEYRVCCLLRHSANPYGISITSLSDLLNYLECKKSYANKIILSLKEKRYLYYEERTGRRGSFEVHFADFILPNKGITSLDKFYKPELVRGDIIPKIIKEEELQQNSTPNSQNLKAIKDQIKSIVYGHSVDSQFRGSNNDNNKENKISIPFKEGTNLSDFNPEDLDERLCLEIATELGEKDINFMLSALKRYGREHLEKTRRAFKEIEKTIHIKNPGAYFNTLLEKTYQGSSDN